MSNKDYGAHKLYPTDKKMPFHDGVVFATNDGWCVHNKEMHNDTELVVENRGLKNRLEEAGYDVYGRALDGNPSGDLPRPRYVAECIAKQCGKAHEHPVVKAAEPDSNVVDPNDGKSPTVEDKPAEDAVEGTESPTEDIVADVTIEDPEDDQEVVTEQKEPDADSTVSEESTKHTKEQLMAMDMKDVRAIGKEYGVTDISKEKLAIKIIEAQG